MKQENKHSDCRTGTAAIMVILLLAGATGSGLWAVFSGIRRFNLILYETIPHANPQSYILFWWSLPLLIPGWWLIYRFYRRSRANDFGWREMLRIFFPVLLLPLPALTPPGIDTAIGAVALLGITVFRAVAAIPAELTFLNGNSVRRSWFWPGMLLAMTAVMIGIGYGKQIFALNRFFLLYCDWGEYLNVANNTWHGHWFINDNGGENFLTTHFSPTSFLLLAPYVGLFHTKEAFMLLNSGILYANVPLLYWLARELKLPRPAAFLIAAAMLLSPSLLNMNVALFYGFHDIYLVMPLLLLFFIFFERKQWTFAWICFALSLLIKETTPVFWAGLGLVWYAWGRRRSGLALFLVSCLYWLLVMKVFIPAISPRPNYDYLCRFSHLGNSIGEIALSPILHPGVVLEYLFRPGCVYFVLLLLLPVFMAALTHPLLLAGASVTMAFICLQDSNQMQNIHLQYQAETVVLVFITAVYAIRRVSNGRPGWWLQLCRWKLPTAPAANLTVAVLLATFATALAAEYCFGDLPGGKSYREQMASYPDMSKEMAQIQQLVPPGVPINTSLNVGGHFLLRNPVRHNLQDPTDDWVLLSLDSAFESGRDIDRLRLKLAQQGYRAVGTVSRLPYHLVLYRRHPEKTATDSLFVFPEDVWTRLTNECQVLPSCPPDLEVKSRIARNTTETSLQILLKLLHKTDRDYRFLIMLDTNAGIVRAPAYFGNGVTPAFLAREKQVYAMGFRLPHDVKINGVYLRIIPRDRIIDNQ